ncbi:MAG: sensor histidine kinase [Candidatus Pristimantibacillus sp.]
MMRINSLFVRILALTLSAILLVSIILTFTSSTISERLLLKQVISNSSTNLNLVKNDLLAYNDQITNAMLGINSSRELKNYVAKPVATELEHLNLVMELGKYIDTYDQYLYPESSHIIVSGMPDTAGRRYSSSAIRWDKTPRDIVERYMTVDGSIPNQILYNSSQEKFVDTITSDHYILATKPLVESTTNWMYGYVAIVMDENNIYNKFKQYVTKGTEISLISSHGVVLSSSDKAIVNEKDLSLLSLAQDVQLEPNNVKSFEHNKQTYISLYLPVYDAFLLEEIDQLVAFAPLYNISHSIIKVVLIILLISILLVYVISRRITRPLHTLVKTMQESNGYNLKAISSSTSGSYETSVLTDAYNGFIQEIDQHVENVIYEQQQRRKADLSALQMQINPHFLYNTLSSIKYLSRMKRNDQVDQTIDSLISMLQSTIGSTEDQVTIDTEIETLKHYVYINQVRYGEQFNVNYQISDDCLPLTVPKLIIQPFVENAFFHAFAGRASGTINIFAMRLDDKLVIEIMDDGIGMIVSDKLEAPKRQHLSGIGIRNVDDRIKLLFGSDYGVDIQSEPSYGTSVKIVLPLISE